MPRRAPVNTLGNNGQSTDAFELMPYSPGPVPVYRKRGNTYTSTASPSSPYHVDLPQPHSGSRPPARSLSKGSSHTLRSTASSHTLRSVATTRTEDVPELPPLRRFDDDNDTSFMAL